MSRHHPSLDDSAFAPLQSLHQILNTDGFSQPFCVLARLQRHLDEGASSKGKDKEGELEWVVAVGMALEGGKREQWWSRVFTREELEMTADITNSVVRGKEMFVRIRETWLRGALEIRGVSDEDDLDKEIELEVTIMSDITPRYPLLPCASSPFSLLSLLSQTIPGALIADSTSTRCEASLAQLESFRKQVDVLKSSNALLKDTIVRSKKIGTSARTPRVKKEGPVIPGVTKRAKITGRPGIVVKKREQEFEDPSDSE